MENTIFDAILRDELQLFKRFLTLPDGLDRINSRDPTNNNFTPLMMISQFNRFEMFSSMTAILHGFILMDLEDKDGNTALHLACIEHHTNIYQDLIARGANIDRRNHRNQTPLMLLRSAPEKRVYNEALCSANPIEKARSSFNAKQFDVAIKYCRAGLEVSNNDNTLSSILASACLEMGKVHMDQNNLDKALALYNEIILMECHLDSSVKSTAYVSRARLCGASGNYDQALRDIQASLDLTPRSVEVHHLKGNILCLLGGKEEDAMLAYNTALQCDPNNTKVQQSMNELERLINSRVTQKVTPSQKAIPTFTIDEKNIQFQDSPDLDQGGVYFGYYFSDTNGQVDVAVKLSSFLKNEVIILKEIKKEVNKINDRGLQDERSRFTGPVSLLHHNFNHTPPYAVLEKFGLDLTVFMTPYNQEFRITLVSHVVSAVNFLHSNSILHGDLRPRNILLCLKGNGTPEVKLCNFSKAHKITPGQPPKYVDSTYRNGWEAPEIANCGGNQVKANISMDIFSLGLLIDALCREECCSKTILPVDDDDRAAVLTDQKLLFENHLSPNIIFHEAVLKCCDLKSSQRIACSNLPPLVDINQVRNAPNVDMKEVVTLVQQSNRKLDAILTELPELKRHLSEAIRESIKIMEEEMLSGMKRIVGEESNRIVQGLGEVKKVLDDQAEKLNKLANSTLTVEKVKIAVGEATETLFQTVTAMSVASDENGKKWTTSFEAISQSLENLSKNGNDNHNQLREILMSFQTEFKIIRDTTDKILVIANDEREQSAKIQSAITKLGVEAVQRDESAKQAFKALGADVKKLVENMGKDDSNERVLEAVTNMIRDRIGALETSLGEESSKNVSKIISTLEGLAAKSAEGTSKQVAESTTNILQQMAASFSQIRTEVAAVQSAVNSIPDALKELQSCFAFLLDTEIIAVKKSIATLKESLDSNQTAHDSRVVTELNNVKIELKNLLEKTLEETVDLAKENNENMLTVFRYQTSMLTEEIRGLTELQEGSLGKQEILKYLTNLDTQVSAVREHQKDDLHGAHILPLFPVIKKVSSDGFTGKLSNLFKRKLRLNFLCPVCTKCVEFDGVTNETCGYDMSKDNEWFRKCRPYLKWAAIAVSGALMCLGLPPGPIPMLVSVIGESNAFVEKALDVIPDSILEDAVDAVKNSISPSKKVDEDEMLKTAPLHSSPQTVPRLTAIEVEILRALLFKLDGHIPPLKTGLEPVTGVDSSTAWVCRGNSTDYYGHPIKCADIYKEKGKECLAIKHTE